LYVLKKKKMMMMVMMMKGYVYGCGSRRTEHTFSEVSQAVPSRPFGKWRRWRRRELENEEGKVMRSDYLST
jgi:hypothetical protein